MNYYRYLTIFNKRYFIHIFCIIGLKELNIMNSAKNIKVEVEVKNREIAELYQGISNLFGKNESNLIQISDMIGESKGLGPRTKAILKKNIEAIFENSNAILNSLGRLGKIRWKKKHLLEKCIQRNFWDVPKWCRGFIDYKNVIVVGEIIC